MREKTYEQISFLITKDIAEIYRYFSIYIYLFSKKAPEIKAGSYGGYDLVKLVEDFNTELNLKSSKLLKNVENWFLISGRKLSKHQYERTIDMCTKPFISIIDDYSKAFKKEFDLNKTLEVSFVTSKNTISSKIQSYLNTLSIISNSKLDKALMWTALGTVFAGISLILSVIAIVS